MLSKAKLFLKSKVHFPFAASEVELKRQRNREKEKSTINKIIQREEKIQNLDTVEEKIIGLNMPRYYGFNGLSLRETNIRYNCLPMIQNLTNTHVISEPYLPQIYDFFTDDVVMHDIFPAIKNAIQESIIFEHIHKLRTRELSKVIVEDKCNMENYITNKIIYQINRIMLAYLSKEMKFLMECQVDQEPRIEAFWYATGLDPPSYVKKSDPTFVSVKYRKGQDYQFPIHYIGSPILQLRSKHPLHEVLSFEDVCANKEEYSVPEQNWSPIANGFALERRHGIILPGFWPGEKSPFGLLSYHNRGYLLRQPDLSKDTNNALTAQAILASYSWLLGQAAYQGFTPFNELTYPLITQTIITNGQWWSFAVYQLNTIALSYKYISENNKTNLLWMTKPMKLYEKIENDTLVDFNDEVLLTLLRMYLNRPSERPDVDMSPYLTHSTQYVAHIEHDERRQWLERRFKHLVSNRPRHRRIPEIPQWQRIFDIPGRNIHIRKREPWQHGINPMARKLDEHVSAYVPKHLRKNPKIKKVGRFENMYYPKI